MSINICSGRLILAASAEASVMRYRVTVLNGDTVTNCATPPVIAGGIAGQTIRRHAVRGVGEPIVSQSTPRSKGEFATGAVEHTVLGSVDYFHTDWDHYRGNVASALVLLLLDFYNL
jgi:iron complex outermembrane receptor protein